MSGEVIMRDRDVSPDAMRSMPDDGVRLPPEQQREAQAYATQVATEHVGRLRDAMAVFSVAMQTIGRQMKAAFRRISDALNAGRRRRQPKRPDPRGPNYVRRSARRSRKYRKG